jgi:hypothetical protein
MSVNEARILTEDEYDQWDRLLERSECGTIFHSSGWCTLCAKYQESDFIIIGVFSDRELIGGCCFYIKKKWSVLKIGYTNLHFTPWGGFVVPGKNCSNIRGSEAKDREIISLILEKIRTLNLFRIKIVNSPGFIDIRALKWNGWIESVSYTYITPLDKDILSNLTSNARSNIRKAERYEIRIKKEYNPEIFWKLTELTYGKQDMQIPFKKEHLFDLMEMLLRNNRGTMFIQGCQPGKQLQHSLSSTIITRPIPGWLQMIPGSKIPV